MIRTIALIALTAALAMGCSASEAQNQGRALDEIQSQSDGYVLVASYPHDPDAFTQGLEFKGKRLFETTGLNGESSLRRVELATGVVKRRFDLPEKHFGEGMTIIGRRLFWITWRSEKAFVFDPATFERLRRYSYEGEGWGLTHNRRRIVMSDGSANLTFRDPLNFTVVRTVQVTDGDQPVTQLNELEWVNGEVLANVWQTSRIARIDPSSGQVEGWIDIRALWEAERSSGDPDVPNGIAYMAAEDRLFVTGKLWKNVYEIRLTD